MQSEDALQLYELLNGYQITQAIAMAAKLKLADLIQNSPKSCSELSKSTDYDEDQIYRLLRALASIGIFQEVNAKEFALTPKAALLKSSEKNTFYSYAIRCGEESYLAWSKLTEGLKKNRSAFAEYYGQEFFSYLAENEQAAVRFNQSMVDHTQKDAMAILENYDFSLTKNIVDVGGGYGQLLCLILNKYSHVFGTLFDRKEVLESARTMLSQNMSPRLALAPGNFLHSVPENGDVYLLKHILHNWSDQEAALILSNCRRSISPTGRLLIIETLVPPGNDAHSSKWHDLHMFVLFNGKERTEAQITELLNITGFSLARVIPLQRTGLSELNIIEATPK